MFLPKFNCKSFSEPLGLGSPTMIPIRLLSIWLFIKSVYCLRQSSVCLLRIITHYYEFASCFGFRSKNGFLEDALTGMAITILQSFSQFRRCAASPAENITRVSTRKSAAVAQAEPMAIPTSMLFSAQGTPPVRPSQVAKPQ